MYDNDAEATVPGTLRSGSTLDRIRQKRAEIATKQTVDLAVPGYDGDLWVRYRAIPRSEVNAFVDRISKAKGNQLMETNADLLIRCCQEIMVRPSEGAALEPIDPDATEPTTFSTATLANLLPIEAGSARDEVFELFSPEGAQPMACGVHSDALANWLQGKSEEIDEKLLGE